MKKNIYRSLLAAALLTLFACISIFCVCSPYITVFFLILIFAYILFLMKKLDAENNAFQKDVTAALKKEDLSSFQHSKSWNGFPYHAEIDELIQKKISAEKEKWNEREYDRHATLEALQSQINPHFLYNTLECIRGQALIEDNKDIAQMLEKLGSFFRYSISRKDNIVTLYDELQNVRRYMYIQNYRFSNRYQLRIVFEEDQKKLERCAVLKLMLQPIVENSILHAFENRFKGRITITVDADETHLILTVSDDGIGMNATVLQNLNDQIDGKKDMLIRPVKTGGNGIALENVNRRIRMLFGKNYGMHIYSTPKSGTDVEIFLPRIDKLSEYPSL